MARAADGIHVATAGDIHIAAPFMAMAWTLSQQSATHPITLHVIDSGLQAATAEALQQLSAASQGRFEVRWLTLPPESMCSLPTVSRYPKEAFLRLLLPALLGGLPKVLWLDCDVLVFGNLRELWHTDLAANAAAAVPEYGARSLRAIVTADMIGSIVPPGKADDPGFNSGILLIDLDRWRADGLGEHALALSCAHANELKFADQDALNVVLAGRWHRLDLDWNVQLGALRSIPVVPQERIYPEVLERAAALIQAPRILHFAGSKPWKSGLRSPYRQEYYDALRRSGFHTPMNFRRARLSETVQAMWFFITHRLSRVVSKQ